MKKLIVTSVFATSLAALSAFAVGLSSPVLAGDEKYFVTIDTVGMCSVVLDIPGTELSAGKKALGNADGYATMEDAKAYLDGIKDEKCEGVVVG